MAPMPGALFPLSGRCLPIFPRRRGRKAFVPSWLNACWRMPGIAFALTVGRRDAFEHEARRQCLVADRQGYHQHAIAVGDVGARGVDWDWKRQLAVIDPNAPFIQQEFLDLFEHAAQVPVEEQATLVSDFDHNVLGFQPRHRCCNHHALVGAVDLHRYMLLLHLFLHLLSLSFHAALIPSCRSSVSLPCPMSERSLLKSPPCWVSENKHLSFSRSCSRKTLQGKHLRPDAVYL